MARLIASTRTIEAPEQIGADQTQYDREWIVTVYDNEVNTYEEVTSILMVATGCTLEEAAIETWEIDHIGKSVVHHASEDECTTVARVISKIGIHVEVSKEFTD